MFLKCLNNLSIFVSIEYVFRKPFPPFWESLFYSDRPRRVRCFKARVSFMAWSVFCSTTHLYGKANFQNSHGYKPLKRLKFFIPVFLP